MLRFVAALVLISCSVASAQPAVQPTVSLDLALAGLGPLGDVRSIETDGNPRTREWLVSPIDTSHEDERTIWRVVAERPTGLCVGPWMDATGWRIERIGHVDWLTRVDTDAQRLDGVRLDTPAC